MISWFYKTDDWLNAALFAQSDARQTGDQEVKEREK